MVSFRSTKSAYVILVGFFFSVPVPVFNRNQGEIERARQEQRQVDARLKALEAEVRNQVQTAYEQYMTSRQLLESIETDMLKQARDVRNTMEYSYRRGEAGFVDFLDAQRTFNDTIQNYNSARADYARSLYQLDSVSGKGNPEVKKYFPLISIWCFLAFAACGGRGSEEANKATPAASPQAQSGVIVIPSDSPKLAQIRVEPVKTAEVPAEEVVTPGKVVTNPNRISRVTLPVVGRVTLRWNAVSVACSGRWPSP